MATPAAAVTAGPDDAAEARVLVLAPTRRDAEIAHALLAGHGLRSLACASVPHLAAEIRTGAGAVLLTDSVLDAAPLDPLLAALAAQPAWSDVPVVVLARPGPSSAALARLLADVPSLTVVERPVQMRTLLSLVAAAVRARARQYQVREHLESVRRAKEEADRANAAKDRFLAVLSHELRTPLGPVLMTAAMLERDPATPPGVARHLSMIRRNVELETTLIDDLLDLSRVANGKLSVDLRPVRVNELLRHVIEMCATDLHRKSIALRFEPAVGADRVLGDPARLQQALWNLVKNAVKFTPEGGTVSVRSAVGDGVVDGGGGSLRVEVEDSGVGIPPDVLPLLFNAFEQGSPAVTKQFGGLGLGLAISKAIADRHGGRITAASDGVGRGACFTIELPLLDSPSPDRATAVPDAAPPREAIARALRLLVVEDHEDTAQVLKMLLQFSGHSVRTAGTAAEALSLADAEAFDLVLSDVGLPDATGFELMRELRDRYGLRGVCMSGYGMESDLEKGRESGFVAHLVKPVSADLLEQTVARLATDVPA